MYFINPNRKYISLKHLILYSSLNAASVEEPELFPLSLKKSYTLFIFTKNVYSYGEQIPGILFV